LRVRYEAFMQRLHDVQAHGMDFTHHAARSVGTGDDLLQDDLLQAALTELSSVLEELRATEDQLRQLNRQLDARWEPMEARSRRDRALFDELPDCALVTDALGVVVRANRAAVDLLGLDSRFLVGRPLTGFLGSGDRGKFLARLKAVAAAGHPLTWRLLLHPRGREPFMAEAKVVAGTVDTVEPVLRWSIRPLRPAADPPRVVSATPGSVDGSRVRAALDGGVASALPAAVGAAVELFQASGAGVMLLDEHGALRWVTASSQADRIFEQAQARLGEGPCLDALALGAPVMSADVGRDFRWPELAPVAAEHGIGAVLSAPIDDVGTFNVMLSVPLEWTGSDVDAVRAFAAVAASMFRIAAEGGHQRALAGQLQHALDQRVTVEQAKGALMARDGMAEEEAWDLLRRTARSSQRKVQDVAREVLDGRRLGPP
jgi:PAS domain-containing protein